ncbi:protein gooseberry-like [Porites lutea]|uniref:protein gooseberry-like n=1 Tax=Porites lutea TaxID=51062 RepID=UPI003CC583EA
MASLGVRPCEISRRLRITHGCISKLLCKYRKTGSIQPGGEGVGRPRVITCHIAQQIDQYLSEQPRIHSREIQARLVQDNICSPENSPSLTSISRLLKKKEVRESAFTEGALQPSNKHSIDSILNRTSTSESSSSVSASSLDGGVGETNDQQQTGNFLDLDEDSHCSSAEVFYPLKSERRKRIKYTRNQQLELEAAYATNQYPSASERDQLAAKLGIAESRIQVWFSNRRMQGKKRERKFHERHFITEKPKDCSDQRTLELHTPPLSVGLGRSRIIFPPGYV